MPRSPRPGPRTPGPPGAGLTIDDLARAAGTTTRQVRALQTRGLLPRPRLAGRTGLYDEAHLDRLRVVLRLHRDGFSLAALAALFRAREAGLTLDEVLAPSPAASPLPGAAEPDAFEGIVAPWRGRLLSVVPSTVIEVPAAS